MRITARFGQPTARGGIKLSGKCRWEVANNSLWDNEGPDLGVDDNVTLRNNILDERDGTPIAGSSDNVNLDPRFVSVGILRLTRNSPLLDAGFNETLFGLLLRLFDGGIRVAGPRIDIGACELVVLFANDFDPPFSMGVSAAAP